MVICERKIATLFVAGLVGLSAAWWVMTCTKLAAQPGQETTVPAPAAEAGQGAAAPQADPPKAKETTPVLVAPSEKRVRALLEASSANPRMKVLLHDQLSAAVTEARVRWEQWLAGRGELDLVHRSMLRLLEAERELNDRNADQVVALRNHFQNLRVLEQLVQGRYEAGKASLADMAEARYYRIQAEIWLERAGEK
jgi:hypothetical protein